MVLSGGPHRSGTLHGGALATIPMHMYQADCTVHRAARKANANATKAGVASFASAKIPGAGMDPDAIQPFQVFKDGFYPVDCVDDYMFAHGDKFGDNKFSYKLGEVSGVSIVHYSMHVAKEDREPMTHDVSPKLSTKKRFAEAPRLSTYQAMMPAAVVALLAVALPALASQHPDPALLSEVDAMDACGPGAEDAETCSLALLQARKQQLSGSADSDSEVDIVEYEPEDCGSCATRCQKCEGCKICLTDSKSPDCKPMCFNECAKECGGCAHCATGSSFAEIITSKPESCSSCHKRCKYCEPCKVCLTNAADPDCKPYCYSSCAKHCINCQHCR